MDPPPRRVFFARLARPRRGPASCAARERTDDAPKMRRSPARRVLRKAARRAARDNPSGYRVNRDNHAVNPCDTGNNPQMRQAIALQSFFSCPRVTHGSPSRYGVKRPAARARAEDPRRHACDRTLVQARMAGTHAAVLLFGRSAQRGLQARARRREPVSGRVQQPAARSAAARRAGGDGRDREDLPGREESARDSRAADAQCVLSRERRAPRDDHASGRPERALRFARSEHRRGHADHARRRPEDRARAARAHAAPPRPEEFRSVLDPAEQRSVGGHPERAGKPARAVSAAAAACRLGGAPQVDALLVL